MRERYKTEMREKEWVRKEEIEILKRRERKGREIFEREREKGDWVKRGGIRIKETERVSEKEKREKSENNIRKAN